jgi:hypothetical protein
MDKTQKEGLGPLPKEIFFLVYLLGIFIYFFTTLNPTYGRNMVILVVYDLHDYFWQFKAYIYIYPPLKSKISHNGFFFFLKYVEAPFLQTFDELDSSCISNNLISSQCTFSWPH